MKTWININGERFSIDTPAEREAAERALAARGYASAYAWTQGEHSVKRTGVIIEATRPGK